MRLPNVKILLCWPSRMHIYGFVWNRTFFNMMEQFDSMRVPGHFSIWWSNLLAREYRDIFQFYGYVGPLECIFMAPLALFNEGVPGHFFTLWRHPRWGSKMQKCCFVGPLACIFMAFFEIAHFSVWWSNLVAWGYECTFPYVFTFVPCICYWCDTLLWSMKSWHRAKADVCFSKRYAQSEDGDGDFMHTSGP